MKCRPAVPEDIQACAVLRGRTRENAISVGQLAAMGITVESWANEVKSGLLTGYVHIDRGQSSATVSGKTPLVK